MARLPRLVAAGLPHHVIQRGNNRQAIFVDDVDRARYRGWVRELAPLHGLAIHAYVLMPNHVHLLATTETAQGLGRFMQAIGRHYVGWFNRRHRRSGGLWEGRYRSTVVDADRYLLACMRYIEMNPVRAGLVAEPAHFVWSSHNHHIGAAVDSTVSDHSTFWALGNTPFERQLAYRQLFELPASEEDLTVIRKATHSGWALGGRPFIEQLLKLTSRRPSKGNRGRSPKQRIR